MVMMILMLCASLGQTPSGSAAASSLPPVRVTGPWKVTVGPGEVPAGGQKIVLEEAVELTILPAASVKITDEKHDALPLYNAAAAPWARGARLEAVITSETTAPDALVPESVVVKTGPGDSEAWTPGHDYAIDRQWGTFGRLPGGIPENTPVWVDYEAGLHRLDTIAVDAEGDVRVFPGQPHNAVPKPAPTPQGMVPIARVFVTARLKALAEDNIYPIVEPEYRPPRRDHPPASRLLPQTWERITRDRRLRVVAWGDSVTAGGEASSVEKRWQNRFVAMLKEHFPGLEVELITAGWGGRNSDSFLAEPPESPYNFERAVIRPKPDLVVMEFVNDAYMDEETVERKYSALLQRFRDAGIEWAILTPHLVWPPWMGKNTAKITEDPRPYVTGVRAFARKHGVALADASLRYCHLAKEGIPFITLMVNSLNHPDDRGHEIFALSLMELFTAGDGPSGAASRAEGKP